ncbi:MAG: UMP kinase [Defluviitaleaceae bacterium]|nr:UMP kinase [Defluviitaleaceae bacterium]
MYKRVVIKLSGEALGGDEGNILNRKKAESIAKELVEISKDTDVSVVVGGGNMWRGRSSDPNMERVKADQMGMLATVMNAIYMADVVRSSGGKSVVLTPFNIGNITEFYSIELANKYFESGYIVFFAAGLGHPFFSTDTIPVLRACELGADAILFAKNIDGVYNDNPSTNPAALRLKQTTYSHIIENRLEALDLEAMVMCEKNDKLSLVFGLNHPNCLKIAVSGDDSFFDFGTVIKSKQLIY